MQLVPQPSTVERHMNKAALARAMNASCYLGTTLSAIDRPISIPLANILVLYIYKYILYMYARRSINVVHQTAGRRQ